MRFLSPGAFLVLFLQACGCTESDGSWGVADTWNDPLADPIWQDTLDASMDAIDASWDLPVENLGEPGWMGSREPYCRDDGRYQRPAVWSDTRGIFASLGALGLFDLGTQLLFNDGTGWRTLIDYIPRYTEPDGARRDLEGIPSGEIWAWSTPSSFLMAMDVESANASMLELDVRDLHFAKEESAYAVTGESPWMVVFDGSSWRPFLEDPLPFPVTLVWTDGDVIFCAGENGTALSLGTEGWTLHDTGTMSDFSSIWGFTRSDVWLGTTDGTLHHYDGEGWTLVDWPDMGDDSDLCRDSGLPIEGMWGADSTLFFHTEVQLVMWDTSGFRVLGYWPGEARIISDLEYHCVDGLSIMDIWGNSSTEVFLAVQPGGDVRSGCREYLLWWDGTEFHRF